MLIDVGQMLRRVHGPASPPAADGERLARNRPPGNRPAVDPRRRSCAIPKAARRNLLAAGHVPALRRAALRRCLPDRRLVQARRRHRAGRQAHLHRLPLLHDGLPLQGALLRPRGARRPEGPRAARQGHGGEAAPSASTASTPSARRPASRPAPRWPAGGGAMLFGDLNDPGRARYPNAWRPTPTTQIRADLGLDPGVRYRNL